MPPASNRSLAAIKPLQQLGGVANHPSMHRRMVNGDDTLGHHLLKVPQAEIVGQVSPDAEQDHGLIELPALEHCVLPLNLGRSSRDSEAKSLRHQIRVKRFHYESHDQFRQHLADFVAAYNFARRLKSLRDLTPYEAICRAWTDEPFRFIHDPHHQLPGPNTLRCPRLFRDGDVKLTHGLDGSPSATPAIFHDEGIALAKGPALVRIGRQFHHAFQDQTELTDPILDRDVLAWRDLPEPSIDFSVKVYVL